MRRLLLAFVGLSLIVAFWVGKDLWVEAQTYGWDEVPAVVTRSEVKVVATLKGSSRNLQAPARAWYQLDLEYAYQSGGADYRSGLVGLLDTPVLNRRKAEDLAARYPVGARVTAHVSPDDPFLAVLEPGLTPLTVVLFLGALLAAAGAGWMARSPEPGRRRPSPRR
ncbi:MAG: DUF3592 domain-containing protein [Tabrizicola sp.]